MPLTLTVQSLQTLARPGESREGDLRAQLDAGRTLSASVKEVVVDTQRPNLFRIKVEAQNMLMELMTSRPLSIGAQVTLGRGSDGALLLSLAGQTSAGQTEALPRTMPPPTTMPRTDSGSPGSGLRLQIPAGQLQNDALARALPLNQPQSGRVLPSVPPPPTAAGNTVPATPNAQAATGTASTPAQTSAQAVNPTARPAVPSGQTQSGQTQPGATSGGSANPATAATQQSAVPPAPGTRTAARPDPTPAPAPNATGSPATSTSAPAPQGAPSAAPTAGGNLGTASPATTPASPGPQPIQNRAESATPRSTDTARATTSGANAATPTPARTGTPAQPQSPAPPMNDPARTADATSGRPAPAATTPPSPAPNRTGPNPVQLAVNGQRIELLTPRPLQAGLNVQLTRTDRDSVQLEILPPKVAPDSQLRMQEGLQQILRDSLPQQIPMADALNQLRQLGRGDSGRQQDAIGQVVRSMMSLFSVSTKPDPKATRQAVEQQLQSSGLMPGAKGAPQSADSQKPATLKQQLARLEQLAERLPPEARERFQTLLQGMHARTATHQASSLQHWQDMPDGGIERQYRLDLPVRLNEQRLENTEIRITQHKRRDEQDRFVSEWSINLHFELQELGAIDSRVSLQREWQLSARFWAERGETAQLIQGRLQDFAAQLSKSGFEIDTLHVQQGRPPAETHPSLSRRLVDLHT